jgi:hypothetical protein
VAGISAPGLPATPSKLGEIMDQFFQSATTVVGDGVFLIVSLSALFVVLVIAAARMPADNPLRRILHAVSLRIGAFLGLALLRHIF